MKKNTKTILIILIALIIVISTGLIMMLQVTVPVANVVKETETIKIGFVEPLSGDARLAGEAELMAAQIAVDEINTNGGVNGRKLEIIAEDGKCDGKEAVTALRKLIEINDVKIVLGGACSGETLAMAPITEEKKIILFSSSSSNPSISDAGEFIFRNSPTDNDFAPAMSKLMYRDGNKKIAIITENTQFAMGLRENFKERFTELGGEIVADEVFPQGSKDYRTQLTKIKEADPDAIFVNPQDDVTGGFIAKQARELKLTQQFYSAYYLSSPKAIEIAGSAIDGTIFLDAKGLSGAKGKALLDKYYALKGTPTNEYLIGASYDRIYILKGALEKCDEDTECIKDYLYTVKDYDGTIGTYGFDSKGDMDKIMVEIKQVQDGKIVDLAPFE